MGCLRKEARSQKTGVRIELQQILLQVTSYTLQDTGYMSKK